YVFEHEPTGRKIYMEVFGFWRKGAIQSRLEALRRHGPQDLILAVSKELAVEPKELEELSNEFYLFRSTPVASDVRKLLNKMLESEDQPPTESE
ncbi:MAG: DUF790 family protein, partial [Planctomycetales bacterium]